MNNSLLIIVGNILTISRVIVKYNNVLLISVHNAKIT